jgi:hypothetical protein
VGHHADVSQAAEAVAVTLIVETETDPNPCGLIVPSKRADVRDEIPVGRARRSEHDSHQLFGAAQDCRPECGPCAFRAEMA